MDPYQWRCSEKLGLAYHLWAHFQPQDSIDSQVRKIVLVLRENLGGESCSCDIEKVIAELFGVGPSVLLLCQLSR